MIIIQTATPPEFKALQLAFGAKDILIAGKRKCFQAGPDIFVLSGGLGKSFAAASAEYAIDAWSPNLVLDFGAAGALVEGLRAGDLVCSNSVVEHDIAPLKKQSEPIPARVLPGVPLFPSFRTIGEDEREQQGVRVCVGGIAAGEENIETVEQRRALAARFNAIAVTWETSAIARVCGFHNVPFASLRMITDVGEGELLEEYKRGVREHLDRAAVAVVRELLPLLFK